VIVAIFIVLNAPLWPESNPSVMPLKNIVLVAKVGLKMQNANAASGNVINTK